MTIAVSASEQSAVSTSARWWQLIFGIICMVMIANLQYGWTLFVNPIDQKYHWGRAAIQVAFSIFVATETWLVPVEGWFVDRFGPRIVVDGRRRPGRDRLGPQFDRDLAADALSRRAIISGIGAGAVYGTCVGNALKWFAGPARAGGRSDGRGLRRRRRRHRGPDPRCDPGTTATSRRSSGSASARASSSWSLSQFLQGAAPGQASQCRHAAICSQTARVRAAGDR